MHIYANENRLGYRANFMRAASLCRSELIAFCDQDDYWYPRKIAASVKPFSDPEVLLIHHNANIVTDSGARIGTLADPAAQKQIVEPLSSGPWTHARGFTEVFRRSLVPLSYLWPKTLDQHDPDQPLAHDQWVFFLASIFGKIAYLNEPLVDYIQHGENAYGWCGESLFLTRVRKLARNRSNGYELLSKVAKGRAAVLDTAKSNLDGILADRAAAGAAYYRTVASVYDRRIILYASPKFADRVSAFRAILGMNGYTGVGGLGRRALVGDTFLGVVPIGSLMRFIRDEARTLRTYI